MLHTPIPQRQTLQWDRDLGFLEQVMRLRRSLERGYSDDPAWQKDIASVLRWEGIYCLKVSHVGQAEQAFRRALALSRKINDTEAVASIQPLLLDIPPLEPCSFGPSRLAPPSHYPFLPQALLSPDRLIRLSKKRPISPRKRRRLQKQTFAFSLLPEEPPKVRLFVSQELFSIAASPDIRLSRGPPPSS